MEKALGYLAKLAKALFSPRDESSAEFYMRKRFRRTRVFMHFTTIPSDRIVERRDICRFVFRRKSKPRAFCLGGGGGGDGVSCFYQRIGLQARGWARDHYCQPFVRVFATAEFFPDGYVSCGSFGTTLRYAPFRGH